MPASHNRGGRIIRTKTENMEIIEVDRDEQYKVLAVSLKVGEAIPLHHATSEAFLIGRKGKGKITFADREVILSEGETLTIKANEPHRMDILEDFSSYIVLDLHGAIKFNPTIARVG